MTEHIVDEGGNVLCAVVRCRDCKYMKYSGWCPNIIGVMPSDGFCAWGERLLTCKCGEEMETEGVCPSCGRYVRRES